MKTRKKVINIIILTIFAICVIGTIVYGGIRPADDILSDKTYTIQNTWVFVVLSIIIVLSLVLIFWTIIRRKIKVIIIGCVVLLLCITAIFFVPTKLRIVEGGWSMGPHYYNILGMEIY